MAKAAEMTRQAPAGTGDNSFVAKLEAANLHPLWDRFKKITPVRPQPRDAPLIWRWKDVEPFAEPRSAKSPSTTWNAARSFWSIRPSLARR